MKNILLGIIFWTILLLIISLIFWIAELLIQVINMNTVMTICYTVLGIYFIYLFKN